MHTPWQRAEKTSLEFKYSIVFWGLLQVVALFRPAEWQLQRIGIQQCPQQRQLVDGYGERCHERVQPEHELQQRQCELEQQQ